MCLYKYVFVCVCVLENHSNVVSLLNFFLSYFIVSLMPLLLLMGSSSSMSLAGVILYTSLRYISTVACHTFVPLLNRFRLCQFAHVVTSNWQLSAILTHFPQPIPKNVQSIGNMRVRVFICGVARKSFAIHVNKENSILTSSTSLSHSLYNIYFSVHQSKALFDILPFLTFQELVTRFKQSAV